MSISAHMAKLDVKQLTLKSRSRSRDREGHIEGTREPSATLPSKSTSVAAFKVPLSNSVALSVSHCLTAVVCRIVSCFQRVQ